MKAIISALTPKGKSAIYTVLRDNLREKKEFRKGFIFKTKKIEPLVVSMELDFQLGVPVPSVLQLEHGIRDVMKKNGAKTTDYEVIINVN